MPKQTLEQLLSLPLNHKPKKRIFFCSKCGKKCEGLFDEEDACTSCNRKRIAGNRLGESRWDKIMFGDELGNGAKTEYPIVPKILCKHCKKITNAYKGLLNYYSLPCKCGRILVKDYQLTENANVIERGVVYG